jgi:ABC-type branched-subunit amino acid transport system substrate-binding protein
MPKPRPRRTSAAAALFALALIMTGCQSGGLPSADSATRLVIAVNAPFSRSPYIGQVIDRGVRLAVDGVNGAGGVKAGGKTYSFAVEKLDNALSPQRALDNIRRAVADHVVAIVDEGTGVDASWSVANQAHVPICVVYQGGVGLLDPASRPNLFRIAPTDHGIAFRLAEYLEPKGLKVGFLHDDSDYGEQGHLAFQDSFGRVPAVVAADIVIPAEATVPAPQVLQAKRAGATALLVWGLSTTVANVVRAARTAGWDVPIYTPPSGEDPLVRQQLSDHPEWVEGLTFAAGRLTAERGPGPFLAFQAAYRKAFGPDLVGVKTSGGKDVTQPPDYGMYPYDFVHLLEAAITAAGGPDGAAVIDALNQVDSRGANGDERGFNEKNHEGVVDDDVFFGVFHDMTWRPVEDDPLSSTLQTIEQTG